MVTLAEKLLEQGRKQGRQQGLWDGYRFIVGRLFEFKFGPVGSDVVARLDTADAATLFRYAERMFTATSVEDVLGE